MTVSGRLRPQAGRKRRVSTKFIETLFTFALFSLYFHPLVSILCLWDTNKNFFHLSLILLDRRC